MAYAPTTVAAIRFGTGFRPGDNPPGSAAELIEGLSGRDPILEVAKIPGTAPRMALIREQARARRARRKNEPGAEAKLKDVDKRYDALVETDAKALIAQAIGGRSGFRERLAMFWTDHFTVTMTNRKLHMLAPDLIRSAIRPHLAGSFPEMLKAVTRHPAMLTFLNQSSSIGPNAPASRGGRRGLNENLAREILELHTLGVGASYTQADVRQFAELLTGFATDDDGFRFRPRWAEPGAETVLGRSYGGERPGAADVDTALADLALHPDTAKHIARKLIVHFIGIVPPADYTEAVAAAYLAGRGDLIATYRALLDDPRAWEAPFRKAKFPFDFVVSALRAVDVRPKQIAALERRQVRRWLLTPLETMGQPLLRANGPDGWDEAPESWITPAGLAARIRWSAAVAQNEARNADPRAFLDMALRDASSELLSRAVAGSETRHEGVALVLASPEFNRR